jgi:DNA-directed RNA polymerase specialized sigma24 family protein
MTPSRPCRCALCKLEAAMLRDIAAYPQESYGNLFRDTSEFSKYTTANRLVSGLRKANADADSDAVFRRLRDAAAADESFVTICFVLAFLPMMHSVTTQIVLRNPVLPRDDVGQQALKELLQFLRSREFQSRTSYIAYSVSRAVKRQTFRWASRQISRAQCEDAAAEVCTTILAEDPFERLVTLRHFLSRNLANGLLDSQDLDLLIEFKLDGNSGDELAQANGISANAVRQRVKRLLAKLHRLANRNGVH